LRENLEAARKENEVLFKEVRVKTDNIIASPERIRKALAEEQDHVEQRIINEGEGYNGKNEGKANHGGIIMNNDA